MRSGPAGHAALTVQVVAGQSAVTSVSATSPMKLLTPRARGPSVWAYLSNLGGGFVAGDETQLDLSLGPEARCFVGTQSSTKVYRNPGCRPCGHVTRASLDDGSILVFKPDPVQAFEGSAYSQCQKFLLARGAGLALVDWLSCGRASRGERWAFTRFRSRNEVWRPREPEPLNHGFQVRKSLPSDPCVPRFQSGSESLPEAPRAGPAADFELAFLDSLVLDPADGALEGRHRMGRFDCLAMLLLIGTPMREASQRLLEATGGRPIEKDAKLACSASPAQDGVLLRIAGECVEQVGSELRQHTGFLTQLLGDDPSARKW